MTRVDGEKRYPVADGLRMIFVAVLVMWVAFAVLIRDNLAQDALPYVVAGDLVDSHPEAVYASEGGDLFTLDPIFATASCAAAPPDTDCANLTVAFVSTPITVPFAIGMAALGPSSAVLLMRLVGALSLAGGMWAIWKRLAHRTPGSARLLVATALLLTPFATVPIAIGQTSPILFLSAALGVTGLGGLAAARRGLHLALVAAVWVSAIAFKAFPAALAVVLIWQRRWKLLAASAAWLAGLVALTFVMAPRSLWSDFLRTTGELSVKTGNNPYNGSVDALVNQLLGVSDLGSGSVLLTVVRFGLALVLAWWAATHLDDDAQWAYAYLVILLIVPLVWWHYLWVAIAAVALTLAGRAKLDDRLLLVLPVLAACTIPISIPNSRGWSVPIAQGLFLLVTVAIVPIVADRGRVTSRWSWRRPTAGAVADPRT